MTNTTFSVTASLTGIHSRSEETVRASRDYDRGRTTAEILGKTFETDARKLVELEIASGFANVSDGQLLWNDFIRPFSESIEGLVSGADLSRWFDTNTFYRKPTVASELKIGREFRLRDKYSSSKNGEQARESRKKISIPGPYTLASLVEDKFYGSKVELVHAFARILKQVISSLTAENEYGEIQINEPSLVYRYGESALTNRSHLEAFLSASSDMLRDQKGDVSIVLHTYFGDCSSIIQELLGVEGVTTLGIDFTQTALKDIEQVKFEERGLGCGCIDARNSLIEPPDWITRFCLKAANVLSPTSLTLIPSSDLKYLPRSVADGKLKTMGLAAEELAPRLK